MRVLKFNEFVGEGLWSKGIVRSKTGDERLEKKVTFNINDIKPVDLGGDVLIADIDLTINGEEEITWEELQDIKRQIEKTGWRIPDWDEIRFLFHKDKHLPPKMRDDITVHTKDENGGVIVYVQSQKTKETVTFPLDNPYGCFYWCEYTSEDMKRLEKENRVPNTGRVMRVNDPKYSYYEALITFANADKKEKGKVRLIKRK